MLRFRLATLACAAAWLGCGGASGDARPSIVLVTLESLRADHVGSYGYARETTPNLDRLAGEATRFERAYAVTSWTLPSHASLFTGLYPSAHGVERPRDRLARGHETLAEALAAEGYQTAAIVSGTYLSRDTQLAQGFEHYDESPITPAGASAAEDLTNARMEAAIGRFLEARDPDRPLFLFLYFWDPHHLYLPPPPFDTRFVPAGASEPAKLRFDPGFRLGRDLSEAELAWVVAQYDGEIRATDEVLGRVRAALEAHDLWDGAAVLVTADHGEEFYDHGLISHKNHVFEEVVRVPLLLKEPGQREARVEPRPVSLVDVFPTVLELAGSPRSGPPGSVSLLAPGPRPPVYLELVTDWWFALPDGGQRHESRRFTAVRDGRHKLVEIGEGEARRRVLFDLERDPGERSGAEVNGDPQAAPLLEALAAWRVRNAELAERVSREGERELSRDEEARLRALGYLP